MEDPMKERDTQGFIRCFWNCENGCNDCSGWRQYPFDEKNPPRPPKMKCDCKECKECLARDLSSPPLLEIYGINESCNPGVKDWYTGYYDGCNYYETPLYCGGLISEVTGWKFPEEEKK